jgi:acid phosphatase (class A)
MEQPMPRMVTQAVLLASLCLAPRPVLAQAGDPRLQTLQPLNLEALIRATGPAPAANSPQNRDDTAIVRWLQDHRSPEEISNAWQVLNKPLLRFDIALGANLEEDAPLLSRGLETAFAPVFAIQQQIKTIYKRPRPFVADPRVQPCIPKEPGYAYPSGHATFYATTGTMLATLVPERRERLLQIGRAVATNRVSCAMHYPSDIEAGVRLGQAAAAQIQASQAWREFIANPAVQAEIDRLRAVPASSLPVIVR